MDIVLLVIALAVGAGVVYRQSPDPHHRVLARGVMVGAAVFLVLTLVLSVIVL